MTRERFLSELQQELNSLPVAEQKEAMDYYRAYFEDADDDEHVIEQLGSPQEVAQSIKEKIASVPSMRKQETNQENEGHYGEFSGSEVHSLEVSIGAAEVVITSGPKFSVEYKNIAPKNLSFGLSGLGKLTICNVASFSNFSFWMRKKDEDRTPARVLIRIPENIELDYVKLSMGAGSMITKTVSIKTKRLDLNVGAGNMLVTGINGGTGKIKCGMGNLEYKGILKGTITVDCGMGKLLMGLSGNEDEYSFEGTVGLGTIQFNKIQKDGIGKIECENKKQNHIRATCGMGLIKINMKEN